MNIALQLAYFHMANRYHDLVWEFGDRCNTEMVMLSLRMIELEFACR